MNNLPNQQLEIKFICKDSWQRKVYRVTNRKGVFLKKYPGETRYFVAYGIEDEPSHEVNESKFEIIVTGGE